MLTRIFLFLALIVAGFAAWVRLAPSDPARWHVPPEPRAGQGDNWVVEIWPGDSARLARLDTVIRASPRMQVLAGSPQEGMITYVPRSKLWRFPDYVTLRLTPEGIVLHARARFGRSDLGVNRARLARWRERLEALEQ